MDPDVLEALRRNSHINLTVDGEFCFQGQPVANPRVQKLFHRGLAVRADGEVTLTVGRMWAYVRCDGVTRFVDGLTVGADGSFARLRDGSEQSLAGATIGYAPDDRFYVWFVVPGPVAVFARDAHQQLSGLLEEGPSVTLGGAATPVTMLDLVPTPTSPSPQSAPGE